MWKFDLLSSVTNDHEYGNIMKSAILSIFSFGDDLAMLAKVSKL